MSIGSRTWFASARRWSGFATVLVPVLLFTGRVEAGAPAVPGQSVYTVALLDVGSGDTKGDARVAELLSQTLSADAAGEVAYLRSPAVQAALIDLHIADPTSAAVPGARLEVERQFLENGAPLGSAKRPVAAAKAQHKRLQVALEIATIADRVQRDWVEAIAARERLAAIETIFESTRIAAQMSKRMAKAGSSAPLDQMRMQVLMAETAAVLGRAKLAVQLSRERLLGAMGIWGNDAHVILADRLPDLPSTAMPAADIERDAVQRRFDLSAARIEVELLAAKLGITEPTSLIILAEPNTPAKPAAVTEPVPGNAENDKARWSYFQAAQKLRAKAVAARSEVREAWINLNGLRDIASHYANTVAPLRQRISQQELLRYNGMLVGVFELITAARQSSEATLAAIDAKRDYWIAKEQLDFVMRAGSGTAASASGGEAVPADESGGGH